MIASPCACMTVDGERMPNGSFRKPAIFLPISPNQSATSAHLSFIPSNKPSMIAAPISHKRRARSPMAPSTHPGNPSSHGLSVLLQKSRIPSRTARSRATPSVRNRSSLFVISVTMPSRIVLTIPFNSDHALSQSPCINAITTPITPWMTPITVSILFLMSFHTNSTTAHSSGKSVWNFPTSSSTLFRISSQCASSRTPAAITSGITARYPNVASMSAPTATLTAMMAATSATLFDRM